MKCLEQRLAQDDRSARVGYYYCYYCCWWVSQQPSRSSLPDASSAPSSKPPPGAYCTPGSQVQPAPVPEALVSQSGQGQKAVGAQALLLMGHHILPQKPLWPHLRRLGIDGYHLAGFGLPVAASKGGAGHRCFSLRCGSCSHLLSPVLPDGVRLCPVLGTVVTKQYAT